MHDTYARWRLITAAAFLLAAAAPAPAAGRPGSAARGGAEYAIAPGPSGEFVLSADVNGLRLEKSIFPDGRTILVLRSDHGEVRIEADGAQIRVTAAGATHRVLPGVADDAAERVRVALARSATIGLFRRLSADVELRGPSSPFEHAVLMSGALVSELAGDIGAIRRLARTQRGVRGARIRQVRGGQFEDCWYHYELSIMRAHDQYLQCLAEGGRVWSIGYCDVRYLAQAETAWFQYLSCSSFKIF